MRKQNDNGRAHEAIWHRERNITPQEKERRRITQNDPVKSGKNYRIKAEKIREIVPIHFEIFCGLVGGILIPLY